MKSNKHNRLNKIILITSLSITVALLVISFITYFVIHNYINKINLVPSENNNSRNESSDVESSGIEDSDLSALDKTDNSEEIEDIEAPEFIDSPQEEINLAEINIRANMEENQTPIMDNKNVINIILIGSDTRIAGGSGRSDAMIIVSINKKSKTITATSIMRDIYLHIPGKRNNRVNAAYAMGGADLLMDTIEQNFKLELNRYASVDFYAFIDVIDMVGGVTLEVTQSEIPVINSSISTINTLTGVEETKDQLTEPGLLLLNGKQALGFVRNRKVGNSDFDRTARQRRVLEQVFDGVKDLNLLELNDLVNIILPQVTTNLTKGEIFSLILNLPSYAKYDLQELRIPIDGSYTNMRVRGMAVLNVDFDKNVNEIQQRIYLEKNN